MWGCLFHTEQERKWHEHRYHHSGRCSERIQRGNKGISIHLKGSIIVAPYQCFFKQDAQNFYNKDKNDLQSCDVRTLWCLLNLNVARQEVIEFLGRQMPKLTKQWMLNLVERYDAELKQRVSEQMCYFYILLLCYFRKTDAKNSNFKKKKSCRQSSFKIISIPKKKEKEK